MTIEWQVLPSWIRSFLNENVAITFQSQSKVKELLNIIIVKFKYYFFIINDDITLSVAFQFNSQVCFDENKNYQLLKDT